VSHRFERVFFFAEPAMMWLKELSHYQRF